MYQVLLLAALSLARVVSVDNSALTTLGKMRYGQQVLIVENGMEVTNIVRAQMELDNFYEVGDIIIINPEEKIARCHFRLPWILGLFGVFAAAVCAFAGWTGFKALFSFALSCGVIWKLVVPLALKGVNASITAFIACAVLTGAIMYLVGGRTRKAWVAFLGAMLGVVAALLFSWLVGLILGVNGATLPFAQTLIYSGLEGITLADIFVAATVIAASGAMMDLAMDIAAGLDEVAHHNPNLGFRELFGSGIRIGKAMVGTMTTTLLLAYSGGYLTLLMVFAAQGTDPLIFINSPIVLAEVAKTLVGSFAIVLVAPFTAMVAAWRYHK